MHANEFALLLLWLLLPPFVLGVAALAFLPMRQRPRGRRLFASALVLLVVAALAAFLFVAVGPSWLGHYVGVRDIELLGARTMWAPFAFAAVALAFPAAAWWGTRGSGNEP